MNFKSGQEILFHASHTADVIKKDAHKEHPACWKRWYTEGSTLKHPLRAVTALSAHFENYFRAVSEIDPQGFPKLLGTLHFVGRCTIALRRNTLPPRGRRIQRPYWNSI